MPCGLPIPAILCPKTVSEDCLFLNVFTPLTATPTSKLPVMVFFHGGNFIKVKVFTTAKNSIMACSKVNIHAVQGYSNSLIYNGEYITNRTSTVVVTVNYRIGALGFLVYGEDESGPRGNYGLKVGKVKLILESIIEAGLFLVPIPGPAFGSGMDPGQHCQLWWGPESGDVLGSKCRSCLGSSAHVQYKECWSVQQGIPVASANCMAGPMHLMLLPLPLSHTHTHTH